MRIKKIQSGKLNNLIAIFDTSIGSDNMGDFIIMDYCNNIINNLFKENKKIYVSTHTKNNKKINKNIRFSKYKIMCGTNILSSSIDTVGGWEIYRNDYANYYNICLLGVGWNNYEDDINKFTKIFLNNILNKKLIHSVRDSYTEKKLREIGFINVLNTACPTMWGLTKNFCELIPQVKGEYVLTTITDYRKDIELDQYMLNILQDNYKKVYIWIQGKYDLEYLKTLIDLNRIICINSSLDELDQVLDKNISLDYIGTRLHAGIRALNHKRRSIIIAIDNRAKEISMDTNLPILERNNLKSDLENKINSKFKTEIILPTQNIVKWKKQFTEL
ncbi:polysaccharide pyruvyl transferase family protein [Clostridium tyrobutyricum]|uniref:polysaccharide pyruvyl transferase family protein n=1 Tax=Clostridium tyrobutyricum TaxID=1519 RepID=UPI001C3E1124|nr:polysaccharide pyruvyl transferase family protein [Clostridium tyrobutyricum]MBV4438485.1 polysaccharide pyruvyl transferase family protein [Clostridium tyrobutyricum]